MFEKILLVLIVVVLCLNWLSNMSQVYASQDIREILEQIVKWREKAR